MKRFMNKFGLFRGSEGGLIAAAKQQPQSDLSKAMKRVDWDSDHDRGLKTATNEATKDAMVAGGSITYDEVCGAPSLLNLRYHEMLQADLSNVNHRIERVNKLMKQYSAELFQLNNLQGSLNESLKAFVETKNAAVNERHPKIVLNRNDSAKDDLIAVGKALAGLSDEEKSNLHRRASAFGRLSYPPLRKHSLLEPKSDRPMIVELQELFTNLFSHNIILTFSDGTKAALNTAKFPAQAKTYDNVQVVFMRLDDGRTFERTMRMYQDRLVEVDSDGIVEYITTDPKVRFIQHHTPLGSSWLVLDIKAPPLEQSFSDEVGDTLAKLQRSGARINFTNLEKSDKPMVDEGQGKNDSIDAELEKGLVIDDVAAETNPTKGAAETCQSTTEAESVSSTTA